MLSASAPSSILKLLVTGRPAWWPDKPSVMYPSILHVALIEIKQFNRAKKELETR